MMNRQNGFNPQRGQRQAQSLRKTQQIGNLDISRIPLKAFLIAVRRRNIVRACIDPSAEDKKNDIKIVTPMGDSTYIQRRELIEKYRYLSGKVINLHGWKRNAQYNVYTDDNSQFYFMQVPTNLTATVNGLLANKQKPSNGDYIVCYGGADGKVDIRTASVIQAKMFHKMFSVPKHDVIVKHKGSKNKFFTPKKRFLVQLQDARKMTTTRAVGNPGLNVGKSGQNVGNGKSTLNPEHPTYSVNAATLPGVDKTIARPLNTPKVNRVKTVGKLMNGSKIVGFVLQIDGKTYRNVTSLQMKALIAKGTVTDVMVQHNNYGVEFFRGNNGTQIENLPEKQVQGGTPLGKYNPQSGNAVQNQSGGFGSQSGGFGAQGGGFSNPYRQGNGNWRGGWSN